MNEMDKESLREQKQENDAEQLKKSIIKRPPILESDQSLLKLAVEDAGNWCYGVKAIDVWIFNPKNAKLVSVIGGSWVDPVYFQNKDPIISEALMKLFNPESSDYMDAFEIEVASGEGLAGALWADTYGTKHIASSERDVPSMATTIWTIMGRKNMDKPKSAKRKIDWRNVEGMANDPDQPYNKRIQVISQAGFKRAAGVPFHVRGGIKGIVVYMARETASIEKLRSSENEEYMFMTSQLIGSILALREPREISMQARTDEKQAIFEKVKKEVKTLKHSKSSIDETLPELDLEQGINGDQQSINKDESCMDNCQSMCNVMSSFLRSWWTKMHGGNVQPPPYMPWSSVVFAMVAVFITVFLMAFSNTYVKLRFGNSLGFELGQIGGLSTLVFTLSASPGAQPRSIIFAQLVCMLVGMTFAHIPLTLGVTNNVNDAFDSPLEWVRVAASVSVACALMARFGIVHPPGGGLAVIFLRYGWTSIEGFQKLGVILLQDFYFIGLAAIINNTNPGKLYPTYWGHIPNYIGRLVKTYILREEKTKAKKS